MSFALRRSGWLAAAIVVVSGLAVTAATARWVANGEDAAALAAFDGNADILVSRMQARLRATTQFLHSTAALGRALGHADKATLDSYASEQDIHFQYPGVIALGFIERRARASAARWPVSYVQLWCHLGPLAPRYDAGAQPELRALLEAARDSGGVAGASRVDAWFGGAPGFILVRPIYAAGARARDTAERRDGVAGFAFVVVDVADMMADLSAQSPPGLAVRVLVDLPLRGHERVLYDSQPKARRLGEARREIESVGGEFWLIETARTPEFLDTVERTRSRLVLALGVLATLFSALLVRQFAGRSAWAEARASEVAAALSESESRYAEAVEAATDGIWVRDETTGAVTVSPRFENLLGLAPGSFARDGSDPLDLVHPADRFQLQQSAAASRQRGEAFAIETRMRHADGHYLWVRLHGRPVRDGQGRIARSIGSITDVSDLHLALERFRDFSQLGSDWFWEQDEHYRFTSFLESAGHHSGLDLSGMIGKTRWQLPIDMEAEEMAAHRALVEARQPFRNFEFRIAITLHDWRWISATGKPIYDDNGRFVGYRGTSTDITARKRLEEELRAHRDNLRTLVEAQTADLVKAKEAAEKASSSKSEFLANMSHELRTPLHGILSFARLGHGKADSAAPEKLREYFDRIFASGERLLELLNNLLDLSKLEAGRMVIEARTIDLHALASEVAKDFEIMVEARHQRLQVVTPDCDTAVHGDPVRLAQVVRNLLSNAVKFTPAGGHVTVAFAPAELPSGRRADDRGVVPGLCMTVADDGIGIPEDELESIFSKFFQGSRTRSGAGGTGLGLAICEEIVRGHRGTLRARNRAEGGAAFDLVLPKGNPA